MRSHRAFLQLLLVAIVASLLMATTLTAAEPEWRAGLSREKITPAMPVFMAGYASRDRPFSKVEQDLYVKVLALQHGDGKKLVLVTSDLIGYPAEVAEPICERLQKKLGLAREQILLNVSHTHTGPMVSLNPKQRGNLSGGDAQRTLAYTRGLQDKVVAAVEKAVKKMTPVKLSWGTGVAHFVMNRREFTAQGVRLGVNPRGLADRSVPVMRIEGVDGKLRAILFGAATHNTTLTGSNYEICGDYAGYAQAHVEKRFPGVQAMFMLGCAGDSNPYPRGTLEIAKKHGKTLGEEVERVLAGKLQPVRGPLKTAFVRAKLPLQAPPPRKQIEVIAKSKRGTDSWVAGQMLAVLGRGEKLPTHYTVPLAAVQFGEDLTLVGLSGEVVVDYVRLLENALGPRKLWIAGYCNDVYGYLPSARVLREGGYETRGLYVGGIGYFSPKAQDVVVENVRKLAEKVGRRLPK